MADRTYRNRDRYDRDRYQSRQAEQFEDNRWRDDEWSTRQMDDAWRDDDERGWDSGSRSYARDSGREWGRDPSYHPGSEGTSSYRRASRYGAERPGYSSFTGNDFGGRDFSTSRFTNQGSYPGGYGAGSRLAANHGEWRDYGANPSRENRDYRDTWGGRDERNWLDRATDTVAGWFSDDDDDDRRERGYGERGYRRNGYRGHGPTGYTRSDERIREDVCDALTDDWKVDARQVTVTVSDGEVTLDGTVPSRQQKRCAEDCVDDVSGVRHVQNNLRVLESSAWDRNNSGETTASRSNTTTTQA